MKLNLRNYARIGRAAITRRVPVYAHFGITDTAVVDAAKARLGA